MDLYNFINRINYVVKPELQKERITHVTDVCGIRIVDEKLSRIAYNFPMQITEALKELLITSIKKEAAGYGYEIVTDGNDNAAG